MVTGDRMTGVVKWFSNVKGYGFVAPDGEGQDDVFVHYTSVVGEGYRTLNEGQAVEFSIQGTDKGPQAIDVVPVSKEEQSLTD